MDHRLIGRRRGHTLPELFVTLALFGLLTAISLVAVTQSQEVYRKTSSRDNVARALTKAWAALRKDLTNSSLQLDPPPDSTMEIKKVPGSLTGGAADGDAINFLSPADPVTGELKISADGSPFFMRQITYYLVVPQNHDTLFKTHCVGKADVDGYEVQCPHKVLIRLMDNPNPVPDPTDLATMDAWNVNWQTLLTRPANLTSVSNNNKIIATNLLTFRVVPDTTNGLLKLDLRAVAIDEASRYIGVGTTPLGTGPYTVQQVTAVVPRND